MTRVVILGIRGFPNVQGGVERRCEKLSVRLVKLGCEVVVFTRRPYVDPGIKEYQGVKLVALPAIRHKNLEAFFHTFIGIFAALRYKADILHLEAIGPALFTPLARILGMKVVVTSHGSNYQHPKWGFFARIFLRLGELLGIIFANEVIAVSESIAKELKEKYKRTVYVIPNGIDIPPRLDSEELLKKHALSRGKYLLSVGRFTPVKAFDKLIEAFGQARMDDWKLVIAGGADHRTEYSRRLIEKSTANPNVILTGFLSGEPLQELFSQAGLFVLPSYYEGLPLALLEAMSYGLSCLASDIPANRSVGLAQQNYFAPGNVSELSAKLREFKGKSLSAEEKSRQLELLRKKYNWDAIAQRTLNVYQRVV